MSDWNCYLQEALDIILSLRSAFLLNAFFYTTIASLKCFYFFRWDNFSIIVFMSVSQNELFPELLWRLYSIWRTLSPFQIFWNVVNFLFQNLFLSLVSFLRRYFVFRNPFFIALLVSFWHSCWSHQRWISLLGIHLFFLSFLPLGLLMFIHAFII